MSRFTTHILIVEDEMTIAMDVEARLKKMGYVVDGIAMDEAEALELIEKSTPDVVLMDIQLGESMGGISLSKKLQHKNFPIIFLTAFADPGTFAQALDTEPAGYVLKPFRDDDLQRTIEIALQKAGKEQSDEENFLSEAPGIFFIRDKGELVRLEIGEIRWLEAMDNYTKVYTSAKTFTVKSFLKDVLEKLPATDFIRVHKSFVVPVIKISRIEEDTLYIDRQSIPIGRQYRAELLQRLRVI
jgi:DNA-binding LytR/AlgR family response regulator